MAKFQEVYEETKEVFNKHINNSGIPGFVNIKILSNEGLKDCFGQVTKAQDIVKFMTDYDVIIQINEPIFDQLEPNQQDYVVKDLLAQIVYIFSYFSCVKTSNGRNFSTTPVQEAFKYTI